MLARMRLSPNVRDLLEGHISLELESIDRLYLNGYVPQLQHGAGLVGFLSQHRGQVIASPALLGQITGKFVAEVRAFAKEQGIPLFHFERNESKDRRAHQLRRERPVRDAVVFIGIAQEKQIVDRPLRGRQFFEELIRDNLDLGRQDRIQLIFPRKIIRTTPGSFRTRVLREGVHPSLHISYKHFDLKQYFKEGRGLRTEGTFHDPSDFGSTRGLKTCPTSKTWATRLTGACWKSSASARTVA